MATRSVVAVLVRLAIGPDTPIITFWPFISETGTTLMRPRKSDFSVILSFRVCARVGVTLNSWRTLGTS
ncbi:hypothetical protein D3C78_1572170 [compost metagenome]